MTKRNILLIITSSIKVITSLFLIILLLTLPASAAWTISGSLSDNAIWYGNSTQDNVTEDRGSHYIKIGEYADNFNDNNHDFLTIYGTPTLSASNGYLSISDTVNEWGIIRANSHGNNTVNLNLSYKAQLKTGGINSEIVDYNRYSNSSNFIFNHFKNTSTRIRNNIAGTINTLNQTSSSKTPNLNTWYEIRTRLNENNRTLWVNEIEVLTAVDSNLTQNPWGFGVYNSVVWIDRIRAWNTEKGNLTTWHDFGTNVTHKIDVNATTPTNTNYSVWYRQNNTGDYVLLNGTGHQDKTTHTITTQYQNTDVRIQLFGNETDTVQLISIVFYEQSPTSNITIPANSWGMFNNWSYTTNFSSISANESNDVALTFYNVTSGEWDSYYPGYSWNSGQVIDKNNSVMGFFNAETTITANTVTPWNTFITAGWNMLYLMGTSNQTLTAICTDMVNCTDIYYYNSTTNDYVNTGTDIIQPNQGFLSYVNQTGTWKRSTI